MSISDDNTSTLSNTDRSDRLQPVFTDGIPIIWDGIDAHLAGILLESKRFFIRTGQFKSLFAFRAAPVGGKGMLAVESFSSVPFVNGSLDDGFHASDGLNICKQLTVLLILGAMATARARKRYSSSGLALV